MGLVDVHPVEALRMLRAGQIDVALIFRYADTPREEEGFRLVHLLDDPIYLVTYEPGPTIADHRDSTWIGGCARCQDELITVCRRAGFTPRITLVSDDMVVMQALVAARMGVTTLPGLALRAHRSPGIHTTELPENPRQIYAVTYGDPPDPLPPPHSSTPSKPASESATSVRNQCGSPTACVFCNRLGEPKNPPT